MKMSKKQKLAIIGFGQFGRFLTKILKPYFEILVSSKTDYSFLTKKIGAKFVSLKEATVCEIIILTVPISAIEEVLKQIKPHIKKNSLIIDVCSVKKYPALLMKKILPKNVEIIATHPLFGPQSGKFGIKGLNIIIWPVRVKRKTYSQFKKFLKKLGLEIIEMKPETHDRTTALWQALTHFIAKGLNQIKMPPIKTLTPSSEKLQNLVNEIKDDSEVLFNDIQKFNPYAKKKRKELIKALQKIDRNL